MNYSVSKYGREHAVFCAKSRCHILFGTKKAMNARAKELNDLDRK